jgi:hypothetical protein
VENIEFTSFLEYLLAHCVMEGKASDFK